MINPFSEKLTHDIHDQHLILQALDGNQNSLEELIYRHQAWIYNIALRMVWLPQDAEDVTQDVLIKMITRLSSFQGKSHFRTWLYRIVAHHVINMKKTIMEQRTVSFDAFENKLDQTPDYDLPPAETLPVEMELILNEIKYGCISAMLLCLDREQRLIFVLGTIFQVTDRIGSEIMNISQDNFRQKLSRARKQLYNFMHNKCGLIDPKNSCHCTRKTKSLLDRGLVDPYHLLYSQNYVQHIKELVPRKLHELELFVDEKCDDLYADQPFQTSPNFVDRLKKVINSVDFQNILNLNN